MSDYRDSNQVGQFGHVFRGSQVDKELTPTEPTPTPNDVREVIASWFYHAASNPMADGFVPYEKVGRKERAVLRDFADELIAGFTDAGFTIRPETGTVTIPHWVAELARHAFLIAEDESPSDENWLSALGILDVSIDAAAPDTGEEK